MARLTAYYGEIFANPDGIRIDNESTGETVFDIENAFWDGKEKNGETVKPIMYLAIAILLGQIVDEADLDSVIAYSKVIRQSEGRTFETAFFEELFGGLPAAFRTDEEGFRHFGHGLARVTSDDDEVTLTYSPKNGEPLSYRMSSVDWHNVTEVVSDGSQTFTYFFEYLTGDEPVIFNAYFDVLLTKVILMAQYADKAYRQGKG